jgi:hypothetical protein
MVGLIVSISCLLTVIGQFTFNAFSKYRLQYGKWEIVELLHGLVNTVMYGAFLVIKFEHITDPVIK